MSEPEKYEINEEHKDEKVPEKEKKLIGEFFLCISCYSLLLDGAAGNSKFYMATLMPVPLKPCAQVIFRCKIFVSFYLLPLIQ